MAALAAYVLRKGISVMPANENGSSKKLDIYHLVGSTLKGHYILEEFVDEGGMSIVYRARDVENQSTVAVKILAPRFLARQEQAETYLKLFKREAEVTQKLKHPNIVTIYDSGVENGTAFIVMEWLEGCTLGEELLKGRISLIRAASILQQVCSALDTAHRQKIIHLDLKPSNIFLVEDGASNDHVKVIDFGLSRIIQSTLGTTISRVVGTPYYIAPEVFTKKASRLSDIYSLGVVAYEILTGLMPFGTSHIYALIHQHIEQPPPSARAANPEIPELIDDLIRRAMSKSPTYRPQSAREFYEEFARSLRSIEDRPAVSKNARPTVYSSKSVLPSLPMKMGLDKFSVIQLLIFMVIISSICIMIFPNIFSVQLTRGHGLFVYIATSLLFYFLIGAGEPLKDRVKHSLFFLAFSPIIWPWAISEMFLEVFMFVRRYIPKRKPLRRLPPRRR